MVTVPGTTPYAWPFDGNLTPGRVALVVAGAQAAWAGRAHRSDEVVRVIRGLAPQIAELGGLVVRLRHRIQLDAGDSWIEVPADVDVRAGGVDGFFASALDHELRSAGRSVLAFVGFGLEGPVHSTLRSANDRGYECITLRDACAPLDPDCEQAAYSTIEMSGGIFGAVGLAGAFVQTLHSTVSQEVG